MARSAPRRLRRTLRLGVATAVSLALSAGTLAVPAAYAAAPPLAQAAAAEAFSVLVFSKTAGFRHSSIDEGIAAIRGLAGANDFTVDATEDATAFTAANLAKYDVVVFLSTTGDVLNPEQQAAFEAYIRGGGGFAGIHSASDTEYEWPFYGNLVGAYFAGHPENQTVTVKTTDRVHPSTAHLPALQRTLDELYNYRTNPRERVHVLQELDEKSYSGSGPGSTAMGADHPITWCQDYEGGRSWYTGMGHTEERFTEPDFLRTILGGLQSAAGVVDANCAASATKEFQKVTLDDGTSNPMDVAPADDGRTFYVERDGRLQIVSPNGGTTTAGRLDVTLTQEYGLVGIELAPDFATSNHIYLYWSPANSPTADRVSRFTMNGNTLDVASEVKVLDVPTQRAECCHMGGALQFDTKGNLYIATGDNTNPFNSDGYTPIDERPGRAAWDAQRTSGNTNDLRGKILRITPQPNGTYTIPSGNLFPEGTAMTRPEVYAMGFRNPFKIGLDPRTDTLLVANYGPDAGSTNPNRGPDGRVEWDAVSTPGNYGWPYCVGDNTAYNDYNFATATAGPKFDCAGGPVNDSPNNTGLTKLPPAIPADVWYGYGANPLFPEIGGGGAPMAGSVYTYDAASTSERKWPAYWDGKAIFGEWNQNRLYSFQLDATTTAVQDITRIMPGMEFKRPHAMEWGADGALYVIEWGSGFGGNNADSGLYRIDYISGSRAPIARVTADKTSGSLPLVVQFGSEGSRDPDGTPVTFAWDFNGDGTTDSTAANPSFTYTTAGNFTATLTVTDADGAISRATQAITAGNTAPVITVSAPPNGGFFDFGDQVAYSVTVTDAEDGTVNCQDVIAQPGLGHAQHSHPYAQVRGCSGTVQLSGDEGHIGADIFGVLTVTYTDKGAAGAGPLTSQEVLVLQPKRKEAEYFSATGRVAGVTSGGDAGVQLETTGDTQGGSQNIGFIEPGDWFAFDPTNLTGIDTISLRAASDPGGTLEVRTGSPTGAVVGSVVIPPTGGWQVYGNYTIAVPASVSKDSGPLYFVNTAGGYNINWVDFVGKGITANARPAVSITATPTAGNTPLTVAFATTATDAEGDTPLTYAWTFGDGGTSTLEDPTHVYATAGTFLARVTVTDSKGAASTSTVEIKTTTPAPTCLTGRSDDFLGSTLDKSRWTTVIRENQTGYRVQDGSLVIPTTQTDIYGTGTGTTPNIVLQDLPSGPFVATAKLTLPARAQYQQAGLVIYGDDNNYAKMVFEGRAPLASPTAANRVFQFIREENGTPNEVADSNTAQLGTAYPDTVWVRFTSTDGTDLKASYSSDGSTFTAMPQTKSLAGITNPKIGFISLAGAGNPVIDATFDWFQITPDSTATGAASPNDEFTGTTLDACRWQVLRPEPSALRVANGMVEIDAANGDIYTTPNTGTSNFLLQPQPAGDWTIETKVDGTALTQQYQQGGLIAYGDDDNYVKLDLLSTSSSTATTVARSVELRSEVAGAIQNPQPQLNNAGTVYTLRLKKTGSTFTGSYSADGTTFTTFATVNNAALGAGTKVGIFAIGTAQTTRATLKFDYFRVLPNTPTDTTAPVVTATTTPAAPNAAGWFTGAVSVAATATDESPGAVTLQYRVGTTGSFLPYTAPFVAPEGTTVLNFRATDAAGNVSAVSTVTVKRDSTAPALTTATTPATADGQAGWYVGAVSVSASATDATSGPATVQYRIGNGAYAPYTGAVTVPEGTTVVDFRATDGAGNVTESTVTVKRDATAPSTAATFAPGNDAGWSNGTVPVTLTGTDAGSGVARTEYSLDGGAWTAYTGPVDVKGDGEHVVRYRSTDVAGNVEAEKATTIKIDGTKPTLLVEGIVANAVYGDSQDLIISWSAADPTSGVRLSSATLDGKPVADGRVLSLYQLALAVHQLSVTATDNAGNVTTVTIPFAVTTSFTDMANLIDRFRATGRISNTDHKALLKQLDSASKPAGQRKNTQAVKELKEFKSLLVKRTLPTDVHNVLARDANALIFRLGGSTDDPV